MEKSQMKSMVVLKNLPSNIIEEAIVVLKPNEYAKKMEYIDKKDNFQKKDKNTQNNNYIIREAESVISNYINIVENKNKKVKDSDINKKYKKLKFYSLIVTIAFIATLIF